jgi:3-methyl-2-oxobutanoate hydroxymethyltransferase
VLVITDLLGLDDERPQPKFVRPYANMAGEITAAVSSFARDVEDGNFPDADHSYR